MNYDVSAQSPRIVNAAPDKLLSVLWVSEVQSELIDRAIEEIYVCAVDPEHWPQALLAFSQALGDVGATMIWLKDDGTIGIVSSPGMEAGARVYNEEGWNARDVRVQLGQEKGLWLTADIVTERHFISEERMAVEPFYTDFLARFGLKWCAAVSIAPDPKTMVRISIQRLASKPPYSDEELQLTVRLGRHAERALRLSLRLLDAELIAHGLGGALARLGVAAFALDSMGRVVFRNDAASSLLGQGVQIVDQRLSIGHGGERQKNAARIARLLAQSSPKSEDELKPIVVPRSQARPLVIYAIPIGHDRAVSEALIANARLIALVLVSDPKQPADPALIRDILGITLGEARVASLIGSGIAPKEAADRLNISEGTVRTTLKSVFAKTGVSRQSELTALVAKLVLSAI